MIYADNWNLPLPQINKRVEKPISQDSETYSSKFQTLLNDSKSNQKLAILFKDLDTSEMTAALNALDKVIAKNAFKKLGGFDLDDVQINTAGLLDKLHNTINYDPKGKIPFPKEQPIVFIDGLANDDPF
jgi:hypothetical protein